MNKKPICITLIRQRIRRGIIFFFIILLMSGTIAAIRSLGDNNSSGQIEIDSNAVQGVPDIEEGKDSGYSTVHVRDGYIIKLCGNPSSDGREVNLYLTNPEDNSVWIRAQILNENEETVAESGIVRQGEYLKAVSLKKPMSEGKIPVCIKIISYKPYTYESSGNVSLKTFIYNLV